MCGQENWKDVILSPSNYNIFNLIAPENEDVTYFKAFIPIIMVWQWTYSYTHCINAVLHYIMTPFIALNISDNSEYLDEFYHVILQLKQNAQIHIYVSSLSPSYTLTHTQTKTQTQTHT